MFLSAGSGVSILWGIEICLFELELKVAVNTVHFKKANVRLKPQQNMEKRQHQETFLFYSGGKENVRRKMSRSLALLRQRLEHDHNTKVAQITSIYSHIYITRRRSVDHALINQ